jgi:hypothetical protein
MELYHFSPYTRSFHRQRHCYLYVSLFLVTKVEQYLVVIAATGLVMYHRKYGSQLLVNHNTVEFVDIFGRFPGGSTHFAPLDSA